ncbi:hypothetical protein FLL45_13015 [Aliikangiella marina]|uniref:Polysaccharide chain length determinant N-terminal domain-containing protein n=1 Tax=Aliikangiella marina TaxID=1712262 RepID=A0A545T993_9GAMM|nr:hypothetical protein [Aliikangiella marina]TQV73784.1 hypothetical protein FLL45_13015 [Aliikangiella marina]
MAKKKTKVKHSKIQVEEAKPSRESTKANSKEVNSQQAKSDESQLPMFKRVLLWSPVNPNRWPRYTLVGLGLIGIVWFLAISYIVVAPPTYRSEWTLVLPGKGAGANVNLVDIGQTSTSAASPYSNSSTSPKANYKAFATSNAVLKNAASSLGMTVSEFGKPRVKLVDQTSLLYFSIDGRTPEVSLQKAQALHKALLGLLDKLRQDEINQHEGSALKALDSYRNKLDDASDQLIRFQSESNLVSMAQFNELVMTIEQLRREKTQSVALLKEIEAKAKKLQQIIDLNSEQAADSLVLQNDSVFQKSMQEFTQAQQRYLTVQSKWGSNHPEVKKAKNDFMATDRTVKLRFKRLVNAKLPKEASLLTLKSDATRNKLMKDLIEYDVLQKGLKEKVVTLEEIIKRLVKERNELTIPASKLDELIRNHQVAEAIFTSALARTDTTKADVFVSYPLVQLLDTPSLPERPHTPKKLFAFVGAFFSTLFVILGLMLLWIRKPYIRKILKSE